MDSDDVEIIKADGTNDAETPAADSATDDAGSPAAIDATDGAGSTALSGQKAASDAAAEAEPVGSDTIFDVSPDMTMSPIAGDQFQMPAQPVIAPAAAAAVPVRPPAPSPAPTIAPAAAVFDALSRSAKIMPANPRAKTVGSAGIEASAAPAKQPSFVETLKTDAGTDKPDLRTIRTYEGDVAEVMSRTRASAASIAIAENVKKQGEETLTTEPKPPSHAFRNTLFALLSLVLLAAGAGGAYYLYSMSPLAPLAQAPAQGSSQQQAAQSLVPVDSTVAISVDGESQAAIVSRVQAEAAKPLAPGSIKEIILTESIGGAVKQVPPADMLKMIDIAPPDMLVRSLSPAWMLGVYSDDTGLTSVFVVATNTFFQNAFAGMLTWEQSMPLDLKPFLPAAATEIGLQGSFQDRIIKNKDVREFVTPAGPQFLYSFIDSNRLVLAGNEQALSAIVARLESQSYVR